MKALKYLLVIVSAILITACGSLPVAQNSGKTDVGYLLFISNKDYQWKDVTVTLDKKIEFDARVIEPLDSYYGYKRYSVATGKHNIKVYYNGNIILKKNIFVSPSETKQIMLP